MTAERETTDWTEVPGHTLPERLGDNGAAWAEAFCQHARKVGHEIDEGWMIGWFANAIEASWEKRTRRAQPPTHPIMQRCAIECYVVPMQTPFIHPPSASQCRCTTHGWMFVTGELMHDGKLCPIGMIERATDEAIRRIEDAKTER